MPTLRPQRTHSHRPSSRILPVRARMKTRRAPVPSAQNKYHAHEHRHDSPEHSRSVSIPSKVGPAPLPWCEPSGGGVASGMAADGGDTNRVFDTTSASSRARSRTAAATGCQSCGAAR